MTTANEHRFPVSVHWLSGRLTEATIDGKDDLLVATPPEFEGGIEGVWSPEDLLVSATASCFVVTLLAFAERRGVPLRALDVHGTGRVAKRDDGRFGFVAIELEADVATDAGCEAQAERAIELAERHCLVSGALAVPVQLSARVRVMPALAGTLA